MSSIGWPSDTIARDGKELNRLANAASPYLRRHADNPVDWYPWGEEALKKAQDENKLILLSIGFHTCLLCHVMERESYSNQQIADILNKNFIAIKVDREQRPDIDETYILATQFFTGAGGWPNNVFLTPDLKPLYGGLYFSPEQFTTVLNKISQDWQAKDLALLENGERASQMLQQIMAHRTEAGAISKDMIDAVAQHLIGGFDPEFGGLGTSGKAANELTMLFLLDRAEAGDKAALAAATKTIDAMIAGALRDQLGGGFHRHTRDRQWREPEFEMMLYGQAGIARVLLQAYRITGKDAYGAAARDLLDFVLRDLQAPTGGFYTSLDAPRTFAGNSVGSGDYYTWSRAELLSVLGPDDGALAVKLFGLVAAKTDTDWSTLTMAKSVQQLAADNGADVNVMRQRVSQIRDSLLKARDKRSAPPRDEKVLTAWNGMMIAALAEGSIVLNDDRYLQGARRAADLFRSYLKDSVGDLPRSIYKGQRGLPATQPDYAYLAQGFLAIYDATGDLAWLVAAKRLAIEMNKAFLDPDAGDYFMTRKGDRFRPKMLSDNELASGNAIAIEVLNKIAMRDLDQTYRTTAERVVAAISGRIAEAPGQNSYALRAISQLQGRPTGPVSMIAMGRVRALATAKADAVNVQLSIALGWHINAHKPLEDFFVPTVITFSSQTGAASQLQPQISYPKPKQQTLQFHDKPLALYDGNTTITARGFQKSQLPKTVQLSVQACSDKVCLNPETVTLSVLKR